MMKTTRRQTLLAAALVHRIRIPFPRWGELVPPYAIGSVAAFRLIERTLGFLA